jgi:hypothetical protein
MRAEHEFRFSGGTIRVRDFLRPAAGRFRVNLLVTPESGRARIVGYDPIAYYDAQLVAYLEAVAAPPELRGLAWAQAADRARLAERVFEAARAA